MILPMNHINEVPNTAYCIILSITPVYDHQEGGADKSLAGPRRKQTTATKLIVYSTHTP